jgi:hypothetical protein
LKDFTAAEKVLLAVADLPEFPYFGTMKSMTGE